VTENSIVNLRALRRTCADCSLRALCLPAGIDLQDLERLDAFVRKPAPLSRGDKLFHAGQAFEFLYVVRSGSLKTVQPAEDGEIQVMGFHLPSELLGLDAISDDHHQCEAIALERTSVCALPFDRLEHMASDFPSLQHQLHRVISREIIHDQEHLAALGRRTARERIALFLCSLSRRLTAAGHSGTDLHLSMSRDEMANYLGLALETVSRLLKKLADDGILDVDRRTVRILEPHELSRIAGQPGDEDRTSKSGDRVEPGRA
jgi:CRP/FNR family transcriptional regulator